MFMFVFGCNESEELRINPKEESAPVKSDPFQLLEVAIEDQLLKIEVSYGGGCEEHDFQVIWPEVITAGFPPDFSVVLNHQGNNDPCFAIITEVLEFDIDQSGLKLSDEAIGQMKITVINGFDHTEKISNK